MKKWAVNIPDKAVVSDLTIKCGISTLAAAVLASRGYSSPDEVIEKLEVSELSDPFLLTDMQAAAETINDAIDSGCRICVYGDYDCDGIMAAVMLYSYLLEAGADVIYYIPERSEGYGLNNNAIKTLADDGVELIITVDNGISAVDESNLIYEYGMRLVVTDHHQPGETLPTAEAVVDPHRNDCFSPFKYLCGAGVVLKLIAALDGGDYTMALEQFGDLAAIATVADIVSLTGENRFITAYGMHLIENTDRPALKALKEISGLTDKSINSNSIGFGLAPRINAAGRFGSPKTAAELFLCEDADQCEGLAKELDQLNTERKQTEAGILNEIYEMIEADPAIIRQRVISLCGKNWHHGIIGIIASKITEQFGKPCFILSDNNGEIRGSARSFDKFSVFEALQFCSETLEKFGGHPGAGGFTVKIGMTEKFNQFLQQFAADNFKNMPIMKITADTPVSPAELNVKTVKGIDVLAPFGCGNEKPLFYISNATILDIAPLSGGVHTRLKLKFGFVDVNALIFRCSPTDLTVSKGDQCDFIVSLDINLYNGKESVSVIVKDYKCCNIEQNKLIAANYAFEAFMRNEKLPPKYYASMLPIRDEVAAIYLKIPENGINCDTLFSSMRIPGLNYCKFLVAIEALCQLKLISHKFPGNRLFRNKAEKRVNLQSAPVLVELNSKINRNN